MTLPALIGNAGERASFASLEFFTARIANKNTRDAYARAVMRFCRWCEAQRVALLEVSSPVVAAYQETLKRELSIATTKQHLAAIRHWMDWLVERGALPINPAAAVRGPRYSVHEGKTPVLEREEARRLFESISGTDVVSLRDRALIAVMLFGFVRVSAVVQMRVRDFEDAQDGWLRLHEKGGKERRIPAHHLVREALRAYCTTAGLDARSKTPLFQSAPRHRATLSGSPLCRSDVWSMVKRRCAVAGLPATICNHSFRATGITIHQEAGGRIEDAAELAGHASTRTTQLYNRKSRDIARSEVERVQL